MTTNPHSRKSSVAHTSTIGALVPINTPSKHDEQHDNIEEKPDIDQEIDPNVYIVQPFKQASKPKDLIERKKELINPSEQLLNSTIEVINHFSLCYEKVKQQLETEQTIEKNKQEKQQKKKVAKQARLRPLIVHQDQNDFASQQQMFIDESVGISPRSKGTETNRVNLKEVYRKKLFMLRKLRPELFDTNGKLLSKKHSNSLENNSSLTQQNSDDEQTMISGLLKENDEKCASLVSHVTETSSISEIIRENSVLKRIDIKTKRNFIE
ncbi:unnamed protein product [Adineta ricciae]|uniref:Uncharacterized protein n=1 Tax=Adineta ricciae TaxID=249248 RepID=A0A815R7J4_ADIRI|nr:unnamed protein product [Adineta ricciae]CAF1473008.1 unnamed protein product [Adineta ricciae]